MKAMNMIRAAILVGILGASPSSPALAGTSDAYPIRNQMVYDGDGSRDAYPIRNQMVYDGDGSRDAYPIRNQMVYDEDSTFQSWLRQWSASLLVRLSASIR